MLALAYSGGRDSSALLHATVHAAARLNADCGAALQVLALHVHHGLSTQADGWERHCQAQCQQWADEGLPLSFQSRRLTGAPARGDSVEAWARDGRYRALSEMAQQAGATLLLLAQHRRDQAETVLLQALRGGGVAGLAAMPQGQERAGLSWQRPWLQQPREAIEAYLAQHRLSHIEDDSNADTRYARNRLRLQVLPALQAAFPQAEQALAQTAQWAQQALALQTEIAASDAAAAEAAGLWRADALDLAALRALSPARANNLLRHWLELVLGQPAPASLVQRLLSEALRRPRHQAAARWPTPGPMLELYRDVLRPLPPPPAASTAGALVDAVVEAVDFSQPGDYRLAGWPGVWRVRLAMPADPGLPADLLRRAELRRRSGGEQFQLQARTPPRGLKKCWQAAAVPASARQAPLLYARDALVYVHGLGLDARVERCAGGLLIAWVPDEA
ncbi:tRNA lysidine(34) synthetase TilS [Paucibacter sp. APW11]|uniref:tRNA(Ile)-lysidine synthase n=1 Tax=Roseateles aquae TaxID=3077235 RepID=A0ABU3P9B6_9BURK|nr:tRNA lysidine(34) synthetase TilS [Paucibacter sp. APW11]MDT8999155.1 tRNA lysidine(34) synthetase TilS [Paucibacter sp. APW11]